MAHLVKIVLGILSVVPFLFFVLVFTWLMPVVFAPLPEEVRQSLFSRRFDPLVPLAVAALVLFVLLTVAYAVLVYRRPALPLAEKIAVPMAIIVTNGLVLPLVFWVYVWRGRGSDKDTSVPAT